MKEEDFLEKLGKKISQRRKSIGMTQEDLALKLGIGRSTLARIEVGGINSSIGSLLKIAKALELQIDELVKL